MFVPGSLRGRLLLLIAVVVATVVAAAEYLESRAFDNAVVAELTRTARSTAMAVADDIEVQRTTLDPTALRDRIHEFIEAVPAVRAISVIALEGGRPTVVASTASNVGGDVVQIGQRAIEAHDTVSMDNGPFRTVATPVALTPGSPGGAIVVSVSFAVLEQIRREAWGIALWLVPGSILVLILLLDLLGDHFVHRPLAGIRKAMQRAAEGDLAARAPVMRQDELGRVANGLNDMLGRLQNFNAELQQRIDAATRELQRRNEELVDTYQRVLSLREALARAEQLAAVGQMAATVAHQVGTPLNLASGYVQMIRDEEASNERLHRRLTTVMEQIDRVTGELRTILARARQPAPRQVVGLSDLLERVTELARPRLERQQIHLVRSGTADCPPIEADVVQLELALLNLVSNGLDAMPNGGTLSIDVSLVSGSVLLEIRDTGTGIPADLLPRVFDPWVTTKAPGTGTGLGLSITRDVIQALGGSIAVRSETGRGTVVAVQLPPALVAH